MPPEPFGRLAVAGDLCVAPPAAESQLQPWSVRLDLARERRARDYADLAD